MSEILKVLAAIPNLGNVKTGLALSWLRWASDPRFQIKIWPPESLIPMCYARNMIRKEFLSGGHDLLFTCDSDIIPPPNILDLAQLGLDVVAPINYIFKEEGVIPLVLKKVEDGWTVKGDLTRNVLEEVDATGLGCCMIARHVLKKVPLFRFIFDEDGMLKGEEGFEWCERVVEAGFKIFVHTGYETSHFKVMDLKLIVRTQNRMRLLEEKVKEYENSERRVHSEGTGLYQKALRTV